MTDEDDPTTGTADGRPSWVQVLALALACLFAGAAGMYWWEHRPARPNDADVGFYDDMTAHHMQAIDIALAYLRRGEDRLLRGMADEIVLFQAGDVRVMQSALREWGEAPADDVAMAWMDMPVPEDEQPGMATPAELRRLDTATGRELDDLFSRLMINHHGGGVHMSEAAATLGRDADVRRFATGWARAQRIEIDELNHAREDLGLPAVDARL